MKLILSRKGFDSSSGGCPNPIFPDGRMLALPIPDKTSLVKYKDLAFGDTNMGTLVHQLTNGKVKGSHHAHLDPDLDKDCYPRKPGWRPILGQHGSAQGHLRNQNVGEGDVFLFWGLFREVEKVRGRWQFNKIAKPKHVIWGWMFVNTVVDVTHSTCKGYEWLDYHPHLQWPDEKNNTLYITSDQSIDGVSANGLFAHFNEHLCLTHPSSPKPSEWRLPPWFYPKGKPALSYHSKPERWTANDNYCYLQSAARGQEFVLDLDYYPEATSWIRKLIQG